MEHTGCVQGCCLIDCDKPSLCRGDKLLNREGRDTSPGMSNPSEASLIGCIGHNSESLLSSLLCDISFDFSRL